ncbi:uroporphyrinogen-III C-methyltransferase [Kangiella sp. TOML190]|uniref:uroporphyrinogen-III C-methyltransferase n=1 Tax=Kangiella sp. TOML190 TaxID=2931351 RepID=UPI00204186F9|nr:uroporphyrinogen-III C-methyltransferase [Kangiella sp. TOML190]
MSNRNFSILITRPEPYASQAEQLFSANDFSAYATPLIDFAPKEFDSDLASEADLVIFISQQAVNFFLDAASHDPQETIALLKQKPIIAVGQATQQALATAGIEAQIPATANSEGILALVAKLAEPEQKIALVRGNQGRKLLEQKLPENYSLAVLEVYQRLVVAQEFPKLAAPKAILITSEQVLSLVTEQLARKETAQLQNSAKSSKHDFAYLCASDRIRDKAQQLGLTNCYTAASASNQDLLEAAFAWRQQQLKQQERERHADQPLELQRATMSESENQADELIEALEIEEQEVASEPPQKKSSPLKWLLALIVIAALAYGGFWLWQQWQAMQAVQQDNSRLVELEKSQQSQSQQLSQLRNSLSQQHTQAAQQRTELEQQIELLQQQLIASQRKFQSLTADIETQSTNWQIAEAEYLIRQAAQKLHYSDDTDSIVALLEAADQQLLSVGDSNLLSLRRAISKDIAQIKSVAPLDIDTILVKLDAVELLLPQLTLASVQLGSFSEQTEPEVAATAPSAWQTFKTNVRNTFSDYYKIHHYDQSVKPFINPQQADLLEQNLRLNIQMAQLAALRHQQTAYDKALKELSIWVNEYYRSDSTSKTLLENLKQLSQAKVAISLPNKIESLSFIKQSQQRQLNQWLQSEQVETANNSNKLAAAADESEEEDVLANDNHTGDIDQKIQDSIKRLEDKKPETNDGDQE